MADSGHLDDGQILAGGFVFPVMQAASLAESGLDTTRPKTSLESRPPADDKLFLNFLGEDAGSHRTLKNCQSGSKNHNATASVLLVPRMRVPSLLTGVSPGILFLVAEK